MLLHIIAVANRYIYVPVTALACWKVPLGATCSGHYAINRLDGAGRDLHGKDIVVIGSARSLSARTTHLPNELALKMDGA
jgi:hypothetical protein